MSEDKCWKCGKSIGVVSNPPSNYCEEHEFDDDYCPDCHHSPHFERCTVAAYVDEIRRLRSELADAQTAIDTYVEALAVSKQQLADANTARERVEALIERYVSAYPEDVFLPVSKEFLVDVHDFCVSKGRSLDALSAHVCRTVLGNLKSELEQALKEKEPHAEK